MGPLGNSERYGGWDPRNPGAPETGHYSFPPRSYMAAEHGNNDAYPQDRGLRNDGGNPKHAVKKKCSNQILTHHMTRGEILTYMMVTFRKGRIWVDKVNGLDSKDIFLY